MLKVLAAAMENADGTSASTSNANATTECGAEFFNTGRVGRRNAMPDILGSHAATSTADLPDQLSALTTTEMPKLSSANTSTSNNQVDIQSTTDSNQTPSTSNS